MSHEMPAEPLTAAARVRPPYWIAVVAMLLTGLVLRHLMNPGPWWVVALRIVISAGVGALVSELVRRLWRRRSLETPRQ